jgi:soluble lytic murein transglycosylase-like protein
MFFVLATVVTIVLLLTLYALPENRSRKVLAQAQPTQPMQTEVPVIQAPAVAETSQMTTLTAGNGGISPIFTPEVRYWESKIVEWAAAYDLDPNIVATIMQIESCGDPQAVSGAGARGLFQVMPFHFSGGEDMLDPDTNARRGLNFYNEQLRYTGQDKLLSFAGYNGGYAASGGDFASWPDETKRYYTWAKGIYEDAAAGASSSETLNTWLAAGGASGCERAAARLSIN